MIISEYPSPWNSVHRPIEYVYNHDTRFISGVTLNAGRLQVTITANFTHTLAVGDEVALSGVLDAGEDISGVYDVYAISGSDITLDLLATTPTLDAPSTLKFVRLPEIELYAGYLPLEEYPNDLPNRLIATFTPENSPENDVRFDVSEYLKSIFTISVPVEGIDFNMFNRFRIKFDGTYKDFYMVLNSSIKTDELNSTYVTTNAPLNSQIPPIVFGCGKTILSYLTGNVVENIVYENADIPVGDYSPADYTDDYYLTE